nr:hypothetical protein CFP56_59419 [Quercus suber]
MEKEKVWITLKNERLPSVCYVCGRIGHDDRHCLQTTEGQEIEYQYGEWLRANGNYNGSHEKIKTRKNESALSNGESERTRSQPLMMMIKDVTATSSGEAQKSGGNQGTGKVEDWGAQGGDGGSGCQVACHPVRWDNSKRSSPNMG